MQQLLDQHQEYLAIPKKGDIITGQIIEKNRNTLYLDLGPIGVGAIYGRELFDDLDTFKNAKIGDNIQATIESLDNEDSYIELSLRTATRERSWGELRRKLETSEVFSTEILDANKGGLIVRVSGIIGFLPVSQLAPDHYPRVEGGDKNKILERLKSYVNETFRVKVITASPKEEKLVVSEKAAIGDEMGEVLEQLKQGKIIKGIVSGVVDFGAFVKFKEGDKELEGLVHISELAWQRIDNPADIVSVGQNVEAKVIGVDGLRISLSLKQLKEDPWKKVKEKYNIGDTIKGEVLKVTPFGGFIKLDDDIHGLLHVSELPASAGGSPEAAVKAGETRDFKVISLEPDEHRLGLSLKALTDLDTETLPADQTGSTKAAPAKEEKPVKAIKEKKAPKTKKAKKE